MKIGSALLAIVVAGLPAIAAPAEPGEPPADPFPCPDSLREGIDFWKKVWGTWSVSQVVLHDTDHPSIVYEVVELPAPVGDVYTDDQRDFVKARREAMAAKVAGIEKKVAAGEPLADDEKAIVLKITEVGGTDALAGASERVRAQRGLRERFRRGLEISGRYHALFARVFREAGLPEDLAYLPHVESSFQAEARSSAGAVGVWQFTRSAARKFMSVSAGVDERLDPVAAARGAARYLKAAYDEFHSWPIAITSYNHGIEGMRAATARFGSDFEKILAGYDGRAFGFASKNFYKEFLAAREIAEDPQAYFPEGLSPEAPLAQDVVELDAPAQVDSLATRYGISAGTLAAMNPAWTARAVSGRVALPAGTRVWLPEGTLATLAESRRPAHRAGVAKPLFAPVPQAAGAAARDDLIVHVVRKGETLFRIATVYGVSLAKLLDVNDLHVKAVIHPGQQILIPR